MENPYTYIFIRKDLTLPQQIVQASHAALQGGHVFGSASSTSFIVLIGMKTEADLLKTSMYLEKKNIEYEIFHEPDNDIGYTAIATKPLFEDQRKFLQHFDLYKETKYVEEKC